MAYKIIKIDPTLASYEKDIDLRMENYKQKKNELLRGQNIVDFSDGYKYFGFHRTLTACGCDPKGKKALVLGNGIAIEPAEGKVYAPCDATVDMMFTTGHAVSLVADNGAEILIHVGLETVSLEGKPFTVHIANGDKVKKGQLLIEADLEAIKAAGLPTITPMLICNTDDYPTFNTIVGKNVTNEDVVIELAK